MAFTRALCRIRVTDPSRDAARCLTLNDCPNVPAEVRLQWVQAFIKQSYRRIQLDHPHDIRDWDLVLGLDGSVENIADSRRTSLPSASLSTTESQQREYSAHYQIPKAVTEHLDPSSEKTICMELFAMGSLLYELSSSRKPFHDRSDEEVQSLYANGDFPDDTWTLPTSMSILCRWCPAFAREVQNSCTSSTFALSALIFICSFSRISLHIYSISPLTLLTRDPPQPHWSLHQTPSGLVLLSGLR